MKMLSWIGGLLAVASIASAAVDELKEAKSLLQIGKMEEPTFPAGMLMQGIVSGEADVILSLDSEGNAIDCLVTGYSEPEFARAAVAAIKHSHFGPIRINGQPASIRPKIHFDFQASGVILSLTAADHVAQRMDRLAGGHRTNKVGTLRDLDEKPRVLHTVSPHYPAALASEKVVGRVTLDFYIDEQGKVRMPALEYTDHDAFVDAAAAALKEWQFAPPTRNGKPVIVQARQVFVFHPEES